jgi:RNA polymerase sigma-70 factor, ECF subfamily
MAAIRSAADAEDVMQETFMLAFQRLRGFRHEASFKTWLLTIAWHRALHRRRSLMWHVKRMVTVNEEFQQPVLPRAPSVEQTLMARERGRDLRRLILKLPARLRDPLLLKATGHVDYEEMAQILGIPTGTARWRVSEARRLLRLKLARMGHW